VSPEIIAALIGGVASIAAAAVGALIRIRSARPKRIDTPRDQIVLPPPDLEPVKPAPAGRTPPAGSVSPTDDEPFDLQAPMPPLQPLPERYKGLSGEDLMVSFISDVEMSRKPEDTFEIVEDK
jgi:hypothetical protein